MFLVAYDPAICIQIDQTESSGKTGINDEFNGRIWFTKTPNECRESAYMEWALLNIRILSPDSGMDGSLAPNVMKQ